LVLLGLVFGALLSYSTLDTAWSTSGGVDTLNTVVKWGGRAGAVLADRKLFLAWLFGVVALGGWCTGWLFFAGSRLLAGWPVRHAIGACLGVWLFLLVLVMSSAARMVASVPF
jgi:hypothetical protein